MDEANRQIPHRWLVLLCSVITIGIGVTTLLGWILGSRLLSAFSSDKIPMAPSSALLFIMLGIVTLLNAYSSGNRKALFIARVLSIAVAAVALTLSLTSIQGIQLDIEHLGLPVSDVVAGTTVGHMSFVSALMFLAAGLTCLSLLIQPVKQTWRITATICFAALIIAMGFIQNIAYLAGAPLFYGGSFIPPAMNTSIAFISVGFALMVTVFHETRISDLKINTQLNISLGMIVFLVALLGTVAMTQSNDVYQQTQSLYNHPLTVTRALGDLKVDILSIQREMRDMLLSDSQQQISNTIQEIGPYQDDISKQLVILYDRYLGPRNDIDNVKKAYEAWTLFRADTIQLVREGRTAEAISRTEATDVGSQEAQQLQGAVQKMDEFAQEKAADFSQSADQLNTAVRTQMGIIIILIILLTAGVMYYLANAIDKPVKQLTSAADEFGQGKLDSRILYSSKNEFGNLSHSFNTMADTIQSNIVEMEAFAYSVSHDLRAPLRGIDGWSLALLEDYKDKLDEQGQQYLNRVRSETQVMGKLIDDMLTFSRQSRKEMKLQQLDMTTMAQDVASGLKEQNPALQAEFVIQPGLKAQGDAGLIEIALNNLLGNALKFSSKNSHCRIEFGETEIDGARAYFVRDNGVGFDMAYANKLFGVFQRLHSSSEFPGTGIGLATVQRIINRHGGRIWAEAHVNQGATFYFTLKEGV